MSISDHNGGFIFAFNRNLSRKDTHDTHISLQDVRSNGRRDVLPGPPDLNGSRCPDLPAACHHLWSLQPLRWRIQHRILRRTEVRTPRVPAWFLSALLRVRARHLLPRRLVPSTPSIRPKSLWIRLAALQALRIRKGVLNSLASAALMLSPLSQCERLQAVSKPRSGRCQRPETSTMPADTGSVAYDFPILKPALMNRRYLVAASLPARSSPPAIPVATLTTTGSTPSVVHNMQG
jgi:hypothetical protein